MKQRVTTGQFLTMMLATTVAISTIFITLLAGARANRAALETMDCQLRSTVDALDALVASKRTPEIHRELLVKGRNVHPIVYGLSDGDWICRARSLGRATRAADVECTRADSVASAILEERTALSRALEIADEQIGVTRINGSKGIRRLGETSPPGSSDIVVQTIFDTDTREEDTPQLLAVDPKVAAQRASVSVENK